MNENRTTTWNLSGRVALITGASRGIGAACAEAMVQAGAHVIAVARSQNDLKLLAEKSGNGIEIWVEDISKNSFRERVEKLNCLDLSLIHI